MNAAKPLRLTNAEALAIVGVATIPEAFRRRVWESQEVGGVLELGADEADDIRELLLEEMVRAGFDADYALTERGRIIDALCDRLLELID